MVDKEVGDWIFYGIYYNEFRGGFVLILVVIMKDGKKWYLNLGKYFFICGFILGFEWGICIFLNIMSEEFSVNWEVENRG